MPTGVFPPHLRSRGERLWRVRKDSRTVEALLRHHPDSHDGSVETQFLYNGQLVYDRQWRSRAEAEAGAGQVLHELQVRGWTTHW